MQEQILLAGSTEKSRMLLQTLLPPGTNPPPRMCMSGAETRRALGEDDWPLLVINTPLSDESGIDLAIDAASHTATSVLMLVKAELADQVQAQLENYGVFVVAKPVAAPVVRSGDSLCGGAAESADDGLRRESEAGEEAGGCARWLTARNVC